MDNDNILFERVFDPQYNTFVNKNIDNLLENYNYKEIEGIKNGLHRIYTNGDKEYINSLDSGAICKETLSKDNKLIKVEYIKDTEDIEMIVYLRQFDNYHRVDKVFVGYRIDDNVVHECDISPIANGKFQDLSGFRHWKSETLLDKGDTKIIKKILNEDEIKMSFHFISFKNKIISINTNKDKINDIIEIIKNNDKGSFEANIIFVGDCVFEYEDNNLIKIYKKEDDKNEQEIN